MDPATIAVLQAWAEKGGGWAVAVLFTGVIVYLSRKCDRTTEATLACERQHALDMRALLDRYHEDAGQTIKSLDANTTATVNSAQAQEALAREVLDLRTQSNTRDQVEDARRHQEARRR